MVRQPRRRAPSGILIDTGNESIIDIRAIVTGSIRLTARASTNEAEADDDPATPYYHSEDCRLDNVGVSPCLLTVGTINFRDKAV